MSAIKIISESKNTEREQKIAERAQAIGQMNGHLTEKQLRHIAERELFPEECGGEPILGGI